MHGKYNIENYYLYIVLKEGLVVIQEIQKNRKSIIIKQVVSNWTDDRDYTFLLLYFKLFIIFISPNLHSLISLFICRWYDCFQISKILCLWFSLFISGQLTSTAGFPSNRLSQQFFISINSDHLIDYNRIILQNISGVFFVPKLKLIKFRNKNLVNITCQNLSLR